MSIRYPQAPFNAIQREHEFTQLLLLFKHFAPKRIMEVGVGHGGGVWSWIFNSAGPVHVTALSYFTGGLDIREPMQQWARETGSTIAALHGNTQDPAIVEEARKLGPYDWIHIDADHSYEGVKKDWENYSTMLAPKGIVAFHDIGVKPTNDQERATIGVRDLWDEISPTRNTTQIIQDQHDPLKIWGIGVIFT